MQIWLLFFASYEAQPIAHGMREYALAKWHRAFGYHYAHSRYSVYLDYLRSIRQQPPQVPAETALKKPKEKDLVVSVLDFSSALLSFVGLDIVPEAIGFVYSEAKGDDAGKVKYLAGILMVGPSGLMKNLSWTRVKAFVRGVFGYQYLRKQFSQGIAEKLDKNLLKKIDQTETFRQEAGLVKKLDADFAAKPELIEAFNKKPELVEGWFILKKINAKEALCRDIKAVIGAKELSKKELPMQEIEEVIKSADRTGVLKEISELAHAPGFENAKSLPEFMRSLEPEINNGKNGLKNNLLETLSRAKKGHRVELDNGMADVVDHTLKEGLQLKTISGNGPKSFFENLKGASKQLRGETNEILPTGYKKIVDIRFDNHSNIMYSKTRSELLQRLIKTNKGNTGEAGFLQGVDEFRIQTSHGVEIFNARNINW